jgi:hypothetical protein
MSIATEDNRINRTRYEPEEIRMAHILEKHTTMQTGYSV